MFEPDYIPRSDFEEDDAPLTLWLRSLMRTAHSMGQSCGWRASTERDLALLASVLPARFAAAKALAVIFQGRGCVSWDPPEKQAEG